MPGNACSCRRWRIQRAGVGAAVEKIEERRQPEDFFGHRKRGCEATSSPSAPAKQERPPPVRRPFLFYRAKEREPEARGACRATPASAASSTPAAYRARQFSKSPLTHFAASPLRKRSRSVRLLGCKRPRDGSLSLPTFCEKKEGASRGWRSGRKNRGKAAARRFFRAPQEGLRSNFEPFCPCHRSKPLFMRL